MATDSLVSIVAALISAGGLVYTAVSKQHADRETAAAAEQTAREKEQRQALEARVAKLEERDHAQDLTLVRVDADVKHMRSALDEVLGLVRQLAGLRPQNPSHPGAE